MKVTVPDFKKRLLARGLRAIGFVASCCLDELTLCVELSLFTQCVMCSCITSGHPGFTGLPDAQWAVLNYPKKHIQKYQHKFNEKTGLHAIKLRNSGKQSISAILTFFVFCN
eukprot:141698-Amphidinium_carterae.1